MDVNIFRANPELGSFLVLLFWGTSIVLQVLFAAGVAHDAGKLMRSGERTAFVGPMVWACATLLGGVFVAAVYWLIHHSTLRREKVWSKEY